MRKLQILIVLFVVVLLASCGEDELKIRLNNGMDTVEINTPWVDAGAILVTEFETLLVYSDDVVDITTVGEYEISYTISYEDTDYSITRHVIVVDQTPPELTLLEGVDTISINTAWIDGGCAVTDNSLEELTCSTTSVVDHTVAGVYEIIYTATDSSGNVGTITRMVTVVE